MYLVYLLGVTVLECIILLNTQHLVQWITNVSQTEFIDSLVLLFSCVRICSLSSLVLFFFFFVNHGAENEYKLNSDITKLHYMVCKCKPSLWGQTVTHLSHRRLSDSQLQPEGPVETSAQPGVRPVVGLCRPRKTPTIKTNDCWRPKPPRPESLAEPIMGTKMRTKNTCKPHVHLASYSYSQRLEPGMHRQAPWICGNLGYHVRPIDNLPHLFLKQWLSALLNNHT